MPNQITDQPGKKDRIVCKLCPSDRRVTYAVITPAGQELMNRIFSRHRRSHLSDQEWVDDN